MALIIIILVDVTILFNMTNALLLIFIVIYIYLITSYILTFIIIIL